MGWKEIGALFCWLTLGLSPLGHSAPLEADGRPESLDVLKRDTREGLYEGDEKSGSKVRHGKLILGQHGSARRDYSDIPESLKPGNGSRPDSNIQSDQADWRELHQLQGSVYGFGVPVSPAVQQLLGMRPKVDCEDDGMTLKVNGGVGSFAHGLLIDRGNYPPLPLSRVPSECGLHVQKTRWSLILVIPYDGCYVTNERDAYILPLRLWGLPAKMYCPSLNLAPSPPSVSCYPNGMIVKTHNTAPVEHLWVKVENEWKPLLKASAKCGYSIVSHSEGVVISAPYKPCLEAKDGVHSLHMAAKNVYKLFCPALVPSIPTTGSSPVSSNGIINTTPQIEPTEASAIPAPRPTIWPWFGHPHQSQIQQPFKPDPAHKQPPVPLKFGWIALRPTSVPVSTQIPTSTASSAKPQNVPQIPHVPLLMGQFPLYTPKPQTPAPFPDVPVASIPQKPTLVPVTTTSTISKTTPSAQPPSFDSPPKKPMKPLPTPGTTTTSMLDPPLTTKPTALGKPSFYPAAPQLLPGSAFTQEHWWPYLPQYLQKHAFFPIDTQAKALEAASALGLTGYHYQAVPQMPGYFYPQRPPWLYPPHYPRPAVFSTAAPSKPLKASSVLAEDSSSQVVKQMSSKFGYSECCPSTALYSSCCPPFLYHHHNHHHFGFPYPVSNPGVAAGGTGNLTSSITVEHSGSTTKLLTIGAPGTHDWHSRTRTALPQQEKIQFATPKFSERPFLHPHDGSLKPTARSLTVLNPFVLPTKHPWAGQVQPLLGSSFKPMTAKAFAYQHKPKPGSLASQTSPELSGTQRHQQIIGQTAEEKNLPPLPISGQTYLGSLLSLPHKSTGNNPLDSYSAHFYDKPLTYSQAKFPSRAGPRSFPLVPEPEKQDLDLLKINPSVSEDTLEPPAHLNAPSQEQVPSAHNGLPNSLNLDSMAHFQLLTGPFSEHWVPVVPPKEAGFLDHLSKLAPLDYPPHGPV